MTAVETDRLLLRPFEPGDVEPYAALQAASEVVRWLPGGEAGIPRARETAERLAAAFAAQWDEVGYGPWAVLERGTARFLGHAGLRWLPEMGETEILYALLPAAWGRGHATEAALAARDHAFGPVGLDRVIAMAMPHNRRSIRVMDKVGLRFERSMEFEGIPAVLHSLGRGAA